MIASNWWEVRKSNPRPRQYEAQKLELASSAVFVSQCRDRERRVPATRATDATGDGHDPAFCPPPCQ